MVVLNLSGSLNPMAKISQLNLMRNKPPTPGISVGTVYWMLYY